jgi:hypothetical protein
VANQDRRMPAEERQPSAWKAEGWRRYRGFERDARKGPCRLRAGPGSSGCQRYRYGRNIGTPQEDLAARHYQVFVCVHTSIGAVPILIPSL